MKCNFVLLCIVLIIFGVFNTSGYDIRNNKGVRDYITSKKENIHEQFIFRNKLREEFNIDSIINKYKNEKLTFENVAASIIDMKIKHPMEVFKQSIKESGINSEGIMYASLLAMRYNNLFGMRKAKKRKTYATHSTYKGYAKFAHWIYSIADYKIWQSLNDFKEDETFSTYLHRRNYAENSKLYGKKINSLKLPENIVIIFNGVK